MTPPGNGAAPTAGGVLVGRGGKPVRARWHVADEAPVALLYDGAQFGVMMLTPRDIEDFAIGFSLTEGIARAAADIAEVRIAEAGDGYLVHVKLAAGIAEGAEERRRSILAGSACGICGAQTLEAALPRLPRVRGTRPDAGAALAALAALPDVQPMNRLNRSTHVAAFAATDGALVLAREDIGRHNALDKLAGALARSGTDPASGFLALSSRLSVEMVTKAARIGVPFVVSASAPSALALRLAARAGLGVASAAGGDLMMFDPNEEEEGA